VENHCVISEHANKAHFELEVGMDDTVRRHKYTLTEDQMPTTWYNIMADLPTPPPPPLHPGTLQPVGP
jgi:hypothetical protein